MRSIHKLTLATVVSLSSLAAGVLLTAPAALAEESCPNAASRRGPSVALPDCRAYEQVTPVNKGDATDLFSRGIENPDRGYPSDDGNSFLLSSGFSSFPNAVSGHNTYVFSRDAEHERWNTTAIVPSEPGVQSISPTIIDTSTNFSKVGFTDEVGSETINFQHTASQVKSLIGAPDGPFATIDSEAWRNEEQTSALAGASEDLSHVILESRNHTLVPGGAAEGQDPTSRTLYESVGGRLRLINVDSAGSLVSACGAVLGQGPPVRGYAHNAVSRDGAKIFFTAPDPIGTGAGCWEKTSNNPPQVYMRLDGTTTVDVSKPNPGVVDLNGLQLAVYVGASADGSKVFFMTSTELTADDTSHAPELYEYNTDTSTLTRVSRGDLESGPAEGNVDFVAAISNAGTAVYFTAFNKLTPEAPSHEAGQVYLYRYDTRTEKTTYIAQVGVTDYVQSTINAWYPGFLMPQSGRAQVVGLDAQANWYATADGQYLVFASKHALTGYDNAAAPGAECPDLGEDSEFSESGLCTEIYRYDASRPLSAGTPGVQDNPACVSCGPPGVLQVENTVFARSAFHGSGGTLNPTGGPPRPISEAGAEAGGYVFFDTATALVPQATSGAVHVYEWHNGTISLISSVGDPADAFFLGSSRDGSDVFFGTHAQLSPKDTDVSGDLYDARIDGGFAGLAAPACTGTGCQGVPAPPPIFATPPSVTFEGVGNFPSPSGSSVKPKTKSLTRAQKLAQALRTCRRERNKRKRAHCETRARRRYGPTRKSNRRGK